MDTIKPLSLPHKDAFIALMSDAFANDPSMDYFFGPSREGASIGEFMAYMFDLSLISGDRLTGMFVGEELVACSILEPPRKFARLPLKNIFKLIARTYRLKSKLPAGSIGRMNHYFKLTRKALHGRPIHYLTMIGVAKKRQGKGFGGELLRANCAEAESHPGLHGLALDTENSRNVAYYEKFGFQLLSTLSLGPANAYVMQRPDSRSGA